MYYTKNARPCAGKIENGPCHIRRLVGADHLAAHTENGALSDRALVPSPAPVHVAVKGIVSAVTRTVSPAGSANKPTERALVVRLSR